LCPLLPNFSNSQGEARRGFKNPTSTFLLLISCCLSALSSDVLRRRQGEDRRRGHEDTVESLCNWGVNAKDTI
jgi:hypothetical protein